MGERLNILWTNGDLITSEKMVLMYAINAKVNSWWDDITLIIWGAPARLVAENEEIKEKIRMAVHIGIHVTACKACAEQLGVVEELEALGVEVKYWGVGLTEILKEDGKLLTI
jgi:hypothetical protein